MISLAKLSVRRPKASLTVWLVVGVALSLIGLGVSKSSSPTITVVPGTQSARAEKLAGAKFFPTQLVLGTGPISFAPAVRWQGQIAAWITRLPSRVTLMSFDQGLLELHLHSGTI